MQNKDRLNLLKLRAENLLSRKYSIPVELEIAEEMKSNYIVCRFKVLTQNSILPDSIIVKMSPVELEKDKTGQSPKYRFLSELASLYFLDNVSKDIKVAPKLIGHDILEGVIITEDIGKHQTIVDLLLGDDSELAEEGLEKMIKQFAKLHSITIGKQEDFEKIQEEFAVTTPRSDSYSDLRKILSKYPDLIESLTNLDGIQFSSEDIKSEINQLETVLLDKTNGNSWSFIHCDSGPQNVLSDPNTTILDYEYGGYGFSYLDTIGYHLAFPQADYEFQVPKIVIDRLDKVYFNTVESLGNEISLPEFQENMIRAAAHWALNRLFNLWILYLEPRLSNGKKFDDDFIERSGMNIEDLNKMIKSMYTLFSSYLRASEKFNGSKIIENLVTVCMGKIEMIIPEIQSFPPFPAFNKH